MDDVFYFTTAVVPAPDLAAFALDCGYAATLHEREGALGTMVSVPIGDDTYALWYPVVPDADLALDDGDRARLREYAPRSAYTVSLHMFDWPRLVPLLKRVMERYGGWVGSDFPAWEPVFTPENIDHTPHPTHQEAVETAARWQPERTKDETGNPREVAEQ